MGKRATFERIKFATLIFVGLAFLAGPLRAQCQMDQIELQTKLGTVSFEVEIADSVAEQSRGLMHRKELPENAGMLFVYSFTRPTSFWMKNTLIPLDMIFINGRGIVHKVHANAIPHDTTSIKSDGPVRAVLEINGGLSRKLGIRPGTVVRHPALPQARAAWPCEN